MGYPISRGDAHDWDDSLPANGWKKVSCSPGSCPAGSVLQYESNAQKGSGDLVTGGERFGHVEIVTKNRDGSTKYCSDKCRNTPGGTVRENFDGAWVYEESN